MTDLKENTSWQEVEVNTFEKIQAIKNYIVLKVIKNWHGNFIDKGNFEIIKNFKITLPHIIKYVLFNSDFEIKYAEYQWEKTMYYWYFSIEARDKNFQRIIGNAEIVYWIYEQSGNTIDSIYSIIMSENKF